MEHPLSQRDQIALYIQTVLSTLLAVVSVFGLAFSLSCYRRSNLHLRVGSLERLWGVALCLICFGCCSPHTSSSASDQASSPSIPCSTTMSLQFWRSNALTLRSTTSHQNFVVTEWRSWRESLLPSSLSRGCSNSVSIHSSLHRTPLNIIFTLLRRCMHHCCQLRRPAWRGEVIPCHKVRNAWRSYPCHNLQLIWRNQLFLHPTGQL